jgi:rhodanese-related sulfurtransferase
MRSFIRSSPQIALHFPLKDTPLMVGCSDGCTYSIDALEALEEAGYTCLVGLKGGFNAWRRLFDDNGERRPVPAGGAVGTASRASSAN